MDTLLQDIRYGFRMAIKNPGLSFVVVLIVALSISASSALYSIIDSTLLNPFPYRDYERGVVLRERFPKKDMTSFLFSVPEYLDLRNRTYVFEEVAAMRGLSVNITDDAYPERLLGARVSANVFSMSGVAPILGRTFSQEEDKAGGEKVVVISHRLWQRRFASDPNILGKQVKLNGDSHSIIGVMPRRYLWWGAELWMPLGLNLADTDRSRRTFSICAYVQPGISIDQANSEMQALSREIEQEHAGAIPEYTGLQIGVQTWREAVLKELKPALFILLGAVGLVLLISCANVCNLLLARASSRQKEILIRLALGASRMRIIRQLLTESLTLSLIGGLLGFLLTFLSINLLVTLIPPNYVPEEAEIRAGGKIFIFALGVASLMALLFALIPTLQLSLLKSFDALKEGGRRSADDRRGRRVRMALVVSEIALAFIVLVGAGLMIRSYVNLTEIYLGFNPENVLSMRIALPDTKYPQPAQVSNFFKELTSGVETLPGVVSCAASNTRPMAEYEAQDFSVEGRPIEESGGIANGDCRVITPNYFQVMEIPLVDGRLFTEQDKIDGLQVTLINQTMADRFWPNENPLGKRIRLGRPTSNVTLTPESGPDSLWLTVVGVVKDVRQRSDILTEIRPEFYMPHAQKPLRGRSAALIVRTNGDPAILTDAVRRKVMALDAEQPIYSVLTMREVVARALGAKRLFMLLLTMFAAISLVLATVGLYAIISYSINQRKHEIGIRMALGAQQSDITRMVVKQAVRLVLVGLAIGLFAAIVLTKSMASLLHGISASDPITIMGVFLLLALIALLASYIPARRASTLDPAIALRQE